MQKRFTTRDYVLFGMLTVLFLSIILTMYMIDRQWLKISEVEQQSREQAADLRAIRKSLSNITSGQVINSSSSGIQRSDEDIPASFQRAYQASKLPGYSEGDWLVRAFALNIKTLTPFIATDRYASDVQGMILESLLTYDPDTLELVGHIARSWTISEDGLTLTFKMRDDVSFSDGVKLTAHDMVFSFDFPMNEKIAAPRERAYYQKIKSVTALDDYTAEFVFKEPYYNSLLMAGSMSIMPKHFYEKFLQTPEEYNESKGILLGSGPYKLRDPSSWKPDKGLVELVRNERYWGPVTATYDRVLWKIIEHDSARLTTFRNGEIDVYTARPLEYKKLLNDKALMARTQNFEYMPPINGYSYIGWNQNREGKDTRFKDRRVREAMTYLTDRNKINKEIYLGYAEIAVSPFNPKSKQHDKSLKPRPYDVEKAKKLLKEAGYEDRDGDGVIEDSAGKKFEFELTFLNSNDDSRRLALLLKDLYARAGIALVPKATEWPVMLESAKKRTFDAMMLGWTSVVESDLYQIFHSSQIEDEADNFVHYKNPELDKCIDEARTTVKVEKRMVLWQRCEKFLYDDQPYTFLKRSARLVFVNKRFNNLKVTNFGLNLAATPLESFVPANEQKYTK
ncbi:Oligopeptide ABC transporter, periplasmic oligopeptide-binding protein OppA (TC 3.A.1.5.1) [hydrothermal vent metagenome]|uniref:Oligopeptide ABC transporter, periplasmic oligopeptide-binding protein OppA (TC 3.A.1.5.1) n=1 Tax=hydrothermal vent metagenome TaxID=652676 RepID=A0A3B0ZFW8_9ZZZZ